MARFDMLLTKDIPPVPADVTIENNFGHVAIQNGGNFLAGGDHIIVSGPYEAIWRWLGKLDGIWVGTGESVMLQQFSIQHLRSPEEMGLPLSKIEIPPAEDQATKEYVDGKRSRQD